MRLKSLFCYQKYLREIPESNSIVITIIKRLLRLSLTERCTAPALPWWANLNYFIETIIEFTPITNHSTIFLRPSDNHLKFHSIKNRAKSAPNNLIFAFVYAYFSATDSSVREAAVYWHRFLYGVSFGFFFVSRETKPCWGNRIAFGLVTVPLVRPFLTWSNERLIKNSYTQHTHHVWYVGISGLKVAPI